MLNRLSILLALLLMFVPSLHAQGGVRLPTCLDSVTPADSQEIGYEASLVSIKLKAEFSRKMGDAIVAEVVKDFVSLSPNSFVFGTPGLRFPVLDFVAPPGTPLSALPKSNNTSLPKKMPVLTGAVSFRIKKGVIQDIELLQTSTDASIDSLLIRAVRKLGKPEYGPLLREWNFKELVKVSLSSVQGRAPAEDKDTSLTTGSVHYRFATHKMPQYVLSQDVELIKYGRFRLPPGVIMTANAMMFIRLTIDEFGKPIPGTVSIDGDPNIARGIVKTLNDWEFQPAMIGNCPIKISVLQPFQIDGGY